MILHVTEAEYRGGCKLLLTFNDGTTDLADLAKHLAGPVFEPLRDLRKFRRFRVDPELGTVVWDNGADLAPEFLKELAGAGPAKSRVPAARRSGRANDPVPAKAAQQPGKTVRL